MTDLLTRAWGDRDGNRCIVAIHKGVVKPLWVKSAEQAAQAAERLSTGGADVYYAPATFDAQARKQSHANGIGGFWLDLDGKDQPGGDYRRGLRDLLRWVQQCGLPKPHDIVASGNGAHVYWWLDAAYPNEQWQAVARHFKQALAIAGINADPTRTADSASILRVPGTRNYKDPANPKSVEVLHSSDHPRIMLDDFRAGLPKVGPLRSVPREPRDDEWNIPDNYPAGNAEQIADSCTQMRAMRDSRGAVSEPFWRAGLSVLQRCDRAEYYIHEWSTGDDRYDPHQTEKKAAATAGPATCAHFNEVNPGGCAGCPWQGRVTSPIQIAVAAAEPPETSDPDETRPTKVGAFKITDAGIYMEVPIPETGEPEPPKRVTQVPMWIREVRERARTDDERDHSSLAVEWRSVDGRDKTAVLHQSDVHDMRSFKSWLADHNIISAVQEVPLLVRFISEYTLNVLRSKGAREYHEALGWYRDGFVTGNSMITAEGAQEALVQSSNPISRIKPRGSLDAWKEGMAVLEKPQHQHHAFALLAGFGSPILQLAGVQSAVVSLVGLSGAGKTLSAKAALSIFGDPEYLSQAASATSNAIERQLSCNRHAPYLLDEVTHLPTHRLTEFIYLAANGQGKAALSRNRQDRQTGTWQLVPFVTSNHPLLEFDQKTVEEAHRRRVLEVYFSNAMGSEDGAALERGLRENAGTAAEPYLQMLCKMRKQVPELFEKAVQRVRSEALIPDANRFGIWTLAAALVGGSIARAAGLIQLDPWAVVRGAMTKFVEDAQDTRTDEERTVDTLREFLTRNTARVVFWSSGSNDLGSPVDNPLARVYENGIVAVHRKEVRDLLREERISQRAVSAWLDENVEETKTVRLAPGSSPVWAYLFKPEVLELRELSGK